MSPNRVIAVYLRKLITIKKGMQINVVNIIIDSLLAKGSCSIESLGTFSLEKQSAAFAKGKTELEPPTSNIAFSENTSGSYPLYKALLEVYPFSENKSKKVVSIFANKVINGLLNFDQVSLTNLGTLTKEGDKINFAPSSQIDRILNKTLPAISLTPFLDAKKTLQQEEEAKKLKAATAISNPTTVVKEKEPVPVSKAEKTPQVVIPSVPKKTEAVSKASVASSEPTSATPQTTKTSLVKEEKSPPPTVSYPSYEEEKEGFLSRFLPWILLLGLLLALFWGGRQFLNLAKQQAEKKALIAEDDGQVDETTLTIDSTSTENSVSSMESEEVVNKEDEEAGLPATDKEGVKIVRPQECIIIAGSFMMNENIDEMANKIRSLGYEVYTEKYGYYIRVGFAFPCDDDDLNLKLFIEEIRAKLSKSAWYLVPDITI